MRTPLAAASLIVLAACAYTSDEMKKNTPEARGTLSSPPGQAARCLYDQLQAHSGWSFQIKGNEITLVPESVVLALIDVREIGGRTTAILYNNRFYIHEGLGREFGEAMAACGGTVVSQVD
jgi:hypothetical protein